MLESLRQCTVQQKSGWVWVRLLVVLGKGTKKGVREIPVKFPSHTLCLQPFSIHDWLTAVERECDFCVVCPLGKCCPSSRFVCSMPFSYASPRRWLDAGGGCCMVPFSKR